MYCFEFRSTELHRLFLEVLDQSQVHCLLTQHWTTPADGVWDWERAQALLN